MEKEVFILGAGFSKGVGAPLQSEILPEIISFNTNKLFGQEKEIFEENILKLKMLLTDHMFLDLDDAINIIDLEDIYTPLDKCIINNYSFRNISLPEVVDYRRSLDALISIYMNKKLEEQTGDQTYISKFADYIVKKKELKKNDFISFITTNWDIIFDNAIFNSLNQKKGVLDYCCYATQFMQDDAYMPSLIAIEKGYFNIKLLKLHGSMNWLLCPRCGRLYVTYNRKISIEQYLSKPICRICHNNYSTSKANDGGATLVGQLLMPTYIKDINNIQIKLIWQNASIELSESSKIIFIGYSFPTADYELRQLLSRCVPHTTSIEVVLVSPENSEVEKRYKSFFGKRKISFNYNGVNEYIQNYILGE